MIALWKIGLSIGVALVGAAIVGVAVIERIERRSRAAPAQQKTHADALAAFDRRKATPTPEGATALPVSEAQRQAWADGWLMSAAKGNVPDQEPKKITDKTCDKNTDTVLPGYRSKPTDPDLQMAWMDGYFSYCGVHVEDLFSAWPES